VSEKFSSISHLLILFLVNFERLDDAVRARKALNGRDVLGSDVGAIRIGFAKVPVKNGQEGTSGPEESSSIVVQGAGDLSVGATIHALRNVKGASTIPADQQVLGGTIENYRSNLLLSMIGSGNHNVSDGLAKPPGLTLSVTEQQMIMKELSAGSSDAELDVQALAGELPVYGSLGLLELESICRIPSSDHVLHYYSSRFREDQQQALGCCQAS